MIKEHDSLLLEQYQAYQTQLNKRKTRLRPLALEKDHSSKISCHITSSRTEKSNDNLLLSDQKDIAKKYVFAPLRQQLAKKVQSQTSILLRGSPTMESTVVKYRSQLNNFLNVNQSKRLQSILKQKQTNAIKAQHAYEIRASTQRIHKLLFATQINDEPERLAVVNESYKYFEYVDEYKPQDEVSKKESLSIDNSILLLKPKIMLKREERQISLQKPILNIQSPRGLQYTPKFHTQGRGTASSHLSQSQQVRMQNCSIKEILESRRKIL